MGGGRGNLYGETKGQKNTVNKYWLMSLISWNLPDYFIIHEGATLHFKVLVM